MSGLGRSRAPNFRNSKGHARSGVRRKPEAKRRIPPPMMETHARNGHLTGLPSVSIKPTKPTSFPDSESCRAISKARTSTEGIAAQMVGTVWLARLDLSQILLRHHLYARVRCFPTCETARLNANDRARVGHASRRRQDFNDISADAVDEEDRRRTLASLQGNELDIARRTVLSQDLAKLTKSRRLVEQRR